MLVPYIYVPHQMEKMQEFIDFIFHQVWCTAPGNGKFSLDLFNGHSELKEVMEAFYYSDSQGGDFFYGHVERIFDLFATLTSTQINQLKTWYQANNDIEQACNNNPAYQLALYSDIAALHHDLGKELASFFKGLYSQGLLGLTALRKKIGEIDEHYKLFITVNTTGKCPFCGIEDIKGIHSSKREAYDHYLPKSKYPFNSINFHNLAPTCHECNSTYKLSRDPAHNSSGRRKAFYPYANSRQPIGITVDLGNPDINQLKPTDIQLAYSPSTLQEQIKTWREVYGIDERYRAKLCSNDAIDWLEQVRILRDAYGVDPVDSLATIQQLSNNSPLANSNFLKTAFLKGCQRGGIFGPITEHADKSNSPHITLLTYFIDLGKRIWRFIT